MSTAEELVALAEGEVGTVESPAGSNRTRYAAEAGHANGQPWCATFCVAMARRLGMRFGNESAYTPSLLGSMPHGPEPRLGALAFFDFPDSVHRVQHVGIVKDWTSSTVTCVEGNTSPGSSGSQSNGGGVWIRTRPRSHVKGFAYPTYTATPEDDMFETIDRQQLAILRSGLEELRAIVLQQAQHRPRVVSGVGYLWTSDAQHYARTYDDGSLWRHVFRTTDDAWSHDRLGDGFVPNQWALMEADLEGETPFGPYFAVSAHRTDATTGRAVWTPGDGWRSPQPVEA